MATPSPKIRYFLIGVAFLVAIFLLTGCSETTIQSQSPPQTPQTTPAIETKPETKEEIIPFDTQEENDSSLEKGQTKVKQEGKEGKKVITYEVIYTDGKEISRKQIKEDIVVKPVTKIVLKGIKEKPAPVTTKPESLPPSSGSSSGSCSGGYINVDGNCVTSPTHSDSAPPGATAHCQDGTYSFSQHRQGTCSHHGGVAEWLD